MRLLGQVAAQPVLGTWEQTKAFWFAAMKYEMHAPEVVAFHRSEATTLITEAPARGSKSYSTAHDILPYALPSTRPLLDSRHAIVGSDYATNKEFEYVYERLVTHREAFRANGQHPYTVERANFNPRSGDMEIVLCHGRERPFEPLRRAVLRGLSSQNEVSLQGEQWTTVTLSEAAEHPEHILTKHFATRTWRTYLPTTPKAKAQWLKALSDAGRLDPSLGVATFHFPPEANPLYDWKNFQKEERLAELRARSQHGPQARAEDDPFFAEQFLGRWVYYAGRVLPFDRRRHVLPLAQVIPLRDRSSFWLSTDYGYEDPWSTGLWQVLPNGIVVRVDEIYERHLSTPEFVLRLDAMLARHGVVRGQLTATGDPSRPEVARLLHDEKIAIVTMDKNAQRDRAAGKRRLIDLLTEGSVPREDGNGYYPGLYVTANCEHAIVEWEQLHYREGASREDAENAFAGEDHAFDDARYFCMSRPFPSKTRQEVDWMREYRKTLATRKSFAMTDLAGTACYA